jgi:hypothetical protein
MPSVRLARERLGDPLPETVAQLIQSRGFKRLSLSLRERVTQPPTTRTAGIRQGSEAFPA